MQFSKSEAIQVPKVSFAPYLLLLFFKGFFRLRTITLHEKKIFRNSFPKYKFSQITVLLEWMRLLPPPIATPPSSSCCGRARAKEAAIKADKISRSKKTVRGISFLNWYSSSLGISFFLKNMYDNGILVVEGQEALGGECFPLHISKRRKQKKPFPTVRLRTIVAFYVHVCT